MWRMSISNEENIEFRFSGSNEIDARELSAFLNETINTFKAIIECNDKDVDVFLKINAFENGSFKILAKTTVELGTKIFKKIKNAKEVVGAFKEFLELKNTMKDKKPESIDGNTVFFNNGGTMNINNPLILNILENDEKLEKVDSSIRRFTKTIPKNRDLNIKDSKGTFKIDNEKKENLTAKIDFDEEEIIERETTEVRELMIKKADVTMNSQWEFIGDKIIKATILDENFKKKVLSQEFLIHYGQMLNLKLKIKTKYSKNMEILETHYEVLEILPTKKEERKLF